MTIRATRQVADTVRTAMGVLTHDEVDRLGGPSSPTLTKILRGDGAAISSDTARKLEKAFGWPRGRVASLAAGEEIAAHRKEQGLSRSEMAELLGAGPKAVADWESGGEIPPRVLERLRQILAAAPSTELLAEVARRVGEAG